MQVDSLEECFDLCKDAVVNAKPSWWGGLVWLDSLLICLVQESGINFEGDADMQFSRVRQFALHW